MFLFVAQRFSILWSHDTYFTHDALCYSTNACGFHGARRHVVRCNCITSHSWHFYVWRVNISAILLLAIWSETWRCGQIYPSGIHGGRSRDVCIHKDIYIYICIYVQRENRQRIRNRRDKKTRSDRVKDMAKRCTPLSRFFFQHSEWDSSLGDCAARDHCTGY